MAYSKKTWVNDEVITKEGLNNIEMGISTNDTAITGLSGKVTALESKVIPVTTSTNGLMISADKTKLDGLKNYTLPAATTSALGGVKQAAAVTDAAQETVTKEEFNALLASLRTAGIIAGS